jgi:glycerate kinase
MKILVCPDKFKESLTAPEAAAQICEGILNAMPDAECKIIPMADGGEGTVDALVRATGGKTIATKVHDPLMRPIEAYLGISGDNNTAFIEMAAASGLGLLSPDERNPLKTTSYGTGELINRAIEQGIKKIIIGIGGSATIDGGVGMAQALGIKFLDENRRETEKGGRYLKNIRYIDISQQNAVIKECGFYAACDVKNVLTGTQGAAFIFGQQKGASPTDIRELDAGLANLAEVISHDLEMNIGDLPGSGAAGGLGAGIVAFLKGELLNGFDLVAEVTRLDEWIGWADIVVTGEGRMDAQTAYGKAPAGVARKAKAARKPVIAFVGSLAEDFDYRNHLGLSEVIPIANKPMSVEQSMQNAGKLLSSASQRTFRLISLGKVFG